MYIAYPIISVIIVSLLSVLLAIPFLLKKKISNKVLLFLLSISVGVLLATVFMDLLPAAFENAHEAGAHDLDAHDVDLHDVDAHDEILSEELHDEAGHELVETEHEKSHKHNLGLAFYVLLGFLIMFLLEKFVHFHHNKKCEDHNCGHGHAYNLAPINLIGDGIHNFIDGLVIAGSYAVNVTLGITTTISIIFHEIPQEIADFGVLLYSGMSKKKAIIFNLLSAVTAIIGAVVGIILVGKLDGFTNFVVPFAAGNFIYIAASNLVPQLHRHCKLWDTLLHILAVIIGIAIIALVITFGPAHAHG